MSVLTELLNPASNGLFIHSVVDMALQHPELLDELWEYGISSDPSAWKAFWIMDKIHEVRPDLIQPYLKPMLENVERMKQSGQKRHMLKLLSLNPLPDEPSVSFINYCFDRIMCRTEPAAIRVHAMQMLYNITLDIPDFKNELRVVIEDAMVEGTPGIICRGQKLLKYL